MTLLQPHWLWWLPLALGTLLVALLSVWARRRSLARFFGSNTPRPWSIALSRPRAIFRALLATCAIAATLLALARPAYDPVPKPVQRNGRDVVFLIDVSKSMLANDLRPSRLERAKLAVADAFEAARGERIALIAFAGTPVVKCPLTTDFSFANLALDAISTDSVSRGGTAIGDAIRAAQALLTANDENETVSKDLGRYRDIVLLTDGEDHETQPLEAAAEAAALNIRIITIGLGSDLQGTQIVEKDTARTMTFEGKPVETRMDPDSLRKIAEATPGGRFYNVGTGSIELDSVYRRLMNESDRRSLESTPTMLYREAFQIPIAVAILCLLAELFIPEAARRRTAA